MAHALVSKREYLQPFLHLMLRDDIVAWHISKTNKVRKDERGVGVWCGTAADGSGSICLWARGAGLG